VPPAPSNHQVEGPLPSNGEEKLVYYPEIASINRKLLDCLFKKSGKEAYLNEEVTTQKKCISTIQN
jgi:hypothetical protein